MATKKSNLKLLSYESLKSEYDSFLTTGRTSSASDISTKIENLTQSIVSLEQEKKELNSFLAKKVAPVTTEGRKSTDLKIKLEKLTESISGIKLLSPVARTTIETAIKSYSRDLETAKAEISDLETMDTTAYSAKALIEHKTLLDEKRNNVKKFERAIETRKSQLTRDDEKIALKNDVEAKIAELQAELEATKKDEKYENRRLNKSHDALKSEYETKKARLKEVISEISKSKKELEDLNVSKTKLPAKNVPSLDTFKEFLLANNFSATHAEELYNYIINNSKSPIVKDFNIRKMHPKRDAFIKKGLIPVTASGTVAGGAMGAVGASLTTAGGSYLGLTVSASALGNFISFGGTGFILGVLASAGVIVGKNIAVANYYKGKYGSSKKTLKDLEHSTDLENLRIVQLMNKVLASKESVLDLREGRSNIFAKAYRGVKRTLINTVNRNRIHHIEAVTKDLIEEYLRIINDKNATDSDKSGNVKLQNIVKLLNQINGFVNTDIESSKIYALLNCNENEGKAHSHMIENLDIYANLKIYLTEALKATESRKKVAKTAKKTSKIKEQKLSVAGSLLNDNGYNLLQGALARMPVGTSISSSSRTPKDPKLNKERTTQRGILDFLTTGDNAQTVADNLGIDVSIVENFIKALNKAKSSGKKLSYTSANCRNLIRDEVYRLTNTISEEKSV